MEAGQVATTCSKVTFREQIRVGENICTLFGYGRPSSSRSSWFQAIYAFYSFASFGFLIGKLLRTVISMDWYESFNASKVAGFVELVWFSQSMFSAIFFVYNTRRGRLESLKRHWTAYGADSLITESGFPRVRWFWICPVLAFFLIVLVATCADVLLQYYGLTNEYESETARMQFWELCLYLPVGVFGVVSWAGPLYIFFVVSIMLSYSWFGLCRKMEKASGQVSKWEEKLLHIADAYDQLISLTAEVNSFYGFYLLVLVSLSVPELFVQLYFFTYLPPDAIRRGQFFFWMAVGILGVIVLFSGSMVHIASNRVSDTFYECYRRERRNGDEALNSNEFIETSILMTKFYHSPVYISACGLYNITKSTLLGIMSLLLTAYCLFFMDATIKLPSSYVENNRYNISDTRL